MSTSALTGPVETSAIKEIVLEHLAKNVNPESLQDQSDLYSMGLTSLASVGLMLALEERFDVEFPESMLGRATFRSVASIAEGINKLYN
jgi:acyl carrier protein